jgi:uncharacterized protein YjiS (DUF1127 family)
MSSMIHSGLRDFHPSSRSDDAGHPSLLGRVTATLRVWRRRVREKHALERLSERDWQDFGASRSDIDSELRRPFWRSPPLC